jgi:hypothetical protein
MLYEDRVEGARLDACHALVAFFGEMDEAILVLHDAIDVACLDAFWLLAHHASQH